MGNVSILGRTPASLPMQPRKTELWEGYLAREAQQRPCQQQAGEGEEQGDGERHIDHAADYSGLEIEKQ